MPKKSATPAPPSDAALWAILEQTSAETGQKYFEGLVQTLARLLNTCGAWVTEFYEEEQRLKALAFWMDGDWIENYETAIEGTPCATVIHTADLVHIQERLLELYPSSKDAHAMGLLSYLGVPLKDSAGRILGHLAVVDRRPMPNDPKARALFQIFAERAGAELRRIQAEAAVRDREEKLSRVVSGAMDAIIELDANFAVTLLNPAAEKLLGCESRRAVGLDFRDFLTSESAERLAEFVDEVCGEARTSAWIGGGLEAMRVGGEKFFAEATLSCFCAGGENFFALVLRNVNERLEAERRIHSLEAEAEYLRGELRELQGADILGQSKALRRVLEEVHQVAATDATVLIQGETGTGKELFARAIHGSSRRHAEPMITVNCAAIPAQLIESEFFGHEKGAFTGATSKREGRFALADRGTIFLDEIGELPLDLQAKLLRVLQEGTFEPVGSGRTQKVDVRVVAATNRDLRRETTDGRFREDLFYRLNVFPIQLPPLRERPEDIPILAEAFARRLAQRLGKRVSALTADCSARLRAYAWPGNVRELENVVERAVITAVAGRLDFARALPPVVPEAVAESAPETPSDRILSAQELGQLERRNYVRALETCGWRISGENGAARMLGLNASTMSSRMKALGIQRP